MSRRLANPLKRNEIAFSDGLRKRFDARIQPRTRSFPSIQRRSSSREMPLAPFFTKPPTLYQRQTAHLTSHDSYTRCRAYFASITDENSEKVTNESSEKSFSSRRQTKSSKIHFGIQLLTICGETQSARPLRPRKTVRTLPPRRFDP